MSRRLLIVALVSLLVACEGETLPWSDDFSSQDGGWHTESDSSADVGYDDGVMRILVKSRNRLAWAFTGREFSDFHLAVEAAQVAGPDNNEYGLLARIQGADRFYRFSISGDGYYQVSKYDGEEWHLLSGDWRPSDAIRRGAATNLLELVCRGATMTFLVNGAQLVEVEDNSYAQGGLGLYAGSFFEPGVEVHFDNLRIDRP